MPRDDVRQPCLLGSQISPHKYPAVPTMNGEYEATVALKHPELSKGKGVPRGWPRTAQRLESITSWTYLARCWDVWVTLLPIAFLGEY